MRLSWPILLLAAPAIAGGAWLLGVHWALALACGAAFGLVCASPDLRGDRWVHGRGSFRPVLPPVRTDARPGEGKVRPVPLLLGLPAFVLVPWHGLLGPALLWIGVAAFVNGLLSWRSGEAVPLLGPRWEGALWRRVASPRLWALCTGSDMVLGLAIATTGFSLVLP